MPYTHNEENDGQDLGVITQGGIPIFTYRRIDEIIEGLLSDPTRLMMVHNRLHHENPYLGAFIYQYIGLLRVPDDFGQLNPEFQNFIDDEQQIRNIYEEVDKIPPEIWNNPVRRYLYLASISMLAILETQSNTLQYKETFNEKNIFPQSIGERTSKGLPVVQPKQIEGIFALLKAFLEGGNSSLYLQSRSFWIQKVHEENPELLKRVISKNELITPLSEQLNELFYMLYGILNDQGLFDTGYQEYTTTHVPVLHARMVSRYFSDENTIDMDSEFAKLRERFKNIELQSETDSDVLNYISRIIDLKFPHTPRVDRKVIVEAVIDMLAILSLEDIQYAKALRQSPQFNPLIVKQDSFYSIIHRVNDYINQQVTNLTDKPITSIRGKYAQEIIRYILVLNPYLMDLIVAIAIKRGNRDKNTEEAIYDTLLILSELIVLKR